MVDSEALSTMSLYHSIDVHMSDRVDSYQLSRCLPQMEVINTNGSVSGSQYVIRRCLGYITEVSICKNLQLTFPHILRWEPFFITTPMPGL